jgi:hypothetical protein
MTAGGKLFLALAGSFCLVGLATELYLVSDHHPVPPHPTPPTAAPPPPTPQQKAAADKAASLAKKAHDQRLRICAVLEDSLVRGGYDVQVSLISDNDAEMLIIGPSVTRTFAYQLTDQALRARLRKAGFWKVIFMRDRFSWVAEWDLFYNTFSS